jgi:uncharacterized membrane protein YdjX (TVP38/TMEM64 family)
MCHGRRPPATEGVFDAPPVSRVRSGNPGMRNPVPRGPWRSLVGPALLLAALAVAARLAAPQWQAWQDRLEALGPLAPAAYLLLWLALVTCGFPAAVLGLVGGAVFGPWRGAALAVAGLFGAGFLMHTLGRRWLRPRVAGLLAGHARLAALDRAAASGGIRLHLLARLSPLNYALVSYTLAAGGAPLRAYVPGLVGGVPGLLAYVWLGSAAGSGLRGPDGGGTMRLVVLLVGAASLLLLGVLVGRALHRATGTPEGDAGRDP